MGSRVGGAPSINSEGARPGERWQEWLPIGAERWAAAVRVRGTPPIGRGDTGQPVQGVDAALGTGGEVVDVEGGLAARSAQVGVHGGLQTWVGESLLLNGVVSLPALKAVMRSMTGTKS